MPDYVVTGQVKAIEITNDVQLPLKVYLALPLAMCGEESSDWAYAKNNYQIYMNALVTAKAAGFTVAIQSTADADGFCQIQALRIE